MLLLTCNMKYFDYSPVLEVHGGHEAVRSDDPLTSHIGMSPTGLLHITQVYLCYVHLIIDLSDQSGTEYNFTFISTLQLHYNAVLYNAVAPKYFSSIMCENVSRRSRYYTMQTVKSILTVFFLA